jgi:hypothetical protein
MRRSLQRVNEQLPCSNTLHPPKLISVHHDYSSTFIHQDALWPFRLSTAHQLSEPGFSGLHTPDAAPIAMISQFFHGIGRFGLINSNRKLNAF